MSYENPEDVVNGQLNETWSVNSINILQAAFACEDPKIA
jgi:hypothetical protein